MYALRGLGETLEREGKWPEAVTIWRKSLPLWRKRGGIEEKESMYTLRKLGLALEAEHNWPEAETVHREALSISSKKGDDDPEALVDLERVVRVLANEEKFKEADQLADKVLNPAFLKKPASVELLVARVNLMGQQGRWQEAADDAAQALELQPEEHYHYHTLAGLLAMTHNRPAYQEICKRLIAKFPNPRNPFVAERLAQDCLLLTNSGVDLKLVDNLADTAVTQGSGDSSMPYFQACKAMSNYRLGRFPEAIAWGEKAADSTLAEAQAKAYAVLAMAHWQLGQQDIAREMLNKGDALAPSFGRGKDAGYLGESWVAWLVARVSLDEATALIEPAAATNANRAPLK
jgi:tetratricopeptide (TPR) repeat protein